MKPCTLESHHPPRVVHLISGAFWAGAEAATCHLLGALHQRSDIEVSALLLNGGSLADRLRELGVTLHIESEREGGFSALARAVRRDLSQADLVHVHGYKESFLAAFSGRPWIATQHGRGEPYAGMTRVRVAIYLAIDLLVKRLAARRVIAVSSELERWLRSRLGQKVVKVYNGIADPGPAVAPPTWKQRPRRVGTLGRLFPVKRYELAIDAVAACPGLELEIVGEGPERDALARRIAASGAADRIHLIGFDADPLPRVAHWRALLVPSLHEGNPISVIESLALGTPVLAADLPGVEEILRGGGGWVECTPPGKAWAGKLARIVDDPELGERASRLGRAVFLEHFVAERAAERVMDVYRDVLAGPEGALQRSWGTG